MSTSRKIENHNTQNTLEKQESVINIQQNLNTKKKGQNSLYHKIFFYNTMLISLFYLTALCKTTIGIQFINTHVVITFIHNISFFEFCFSNKVQKFENSANHQKRIRKLLRLSGILFFHKLQSMTDCLSKKYEIYTTN